MEPLESSANESRDEAASIDADAAELASYGYVQQLRRTMGAFSSFALSFSLISIVTGIFANFSFGFRQVGPAIFWSWTLVAAGQFLIALVLADLATRIPLSGYGYQWSTRLVNPHYGFFVGWLLLMQFLAGFPGVCHALATTVCSSTLDDATATSWIPWVAIGLVSLTALLHLFGIRLASLVNDMGVVAEILAVLLLIGVLLGIHFVSGAHELTFLLSSARPIDGEPAGVSAFALSLLMGAWCLTGFEAAADLAEETRRPRYIIPRVILTSELSAAVCGCLVLAVLLLSIDDVSAAAAHDNLVVATLNDKLGNTWMPLVMLVVSVSIFACGVASMAAATRLVFSLARDNMLPFSPVLRGVHARWKTPVGAILLVWAVSTAVILGFRRLEIITSISATAGFLGYAGIVGASFRTRGCTDGFSLGRFRTPIRVASFVWALAVVAALTIPEADTSPGAIAHLPAKSAVGACAVGAAIYFFVIRARIARGQAGTPGAELRTLE